MAERYIADQAIADYNQQQVDRGDAAYTEDFSGIIDRPQRNIRNVKGFIPEASFHEAVSDLTAEQEANNKAWLAYQAMLSEGEEIANQDDRFDPEYETYIDGRRVDDGSYSPELIDEPATDDSSSDSIDDSGETGEQDSNDDEEEDGDIWEHVVVDDPSTWPDPDDVVEQLQEVSEYFQPDPDAMREFRQIADYAESKGDYEYACVTRACQKAHAGVWSIQRAYQEVVEDIGIQEALRIWVDLEANGVIRF